MFIHGLFIIDLLNLEIKPVKDAVLFLSCAVNQMSASEYINLESMILSYLYSLK